MADQQFTTTVIGFMDGKAVPVQLSHKMIESKGFSWGQLISSIQETKEEAKVQDKVIVTATQEPDDDTE